MPILGGSPLGLIGVESRPTKTGLSTFNGGRTRNVNVNLYNVGQETDRERMGKTNNQKGGIFSLFTGGNIVKPWPNISSTGALSEPRLGLSGGADENYKGLSRSTLHNNDVYDTSILNIIEKMANTYASLRPSDFAYLKNIGVFPNNRLMIARRFYGPMSDDIFIKGKQAMSTMITWVPQNENFLELQYGEEWVEANADFTEVINNIAQDLLGKSVAGTLSGMLGAVPLPGFTEGITREILKSLGVYEEGSGKILPAGDPNLIKQAKRRKTIKYSEAGSGLRCTCSIKMICEYEQKFISGIDPTIAWQDIIANAVRFGTSPGNSYGLSSKFGSKVISWVKDPGKIITEFATMISTAITKIKGEILAYFDEQINKASSSGEEGEEGGTSGEEEDDSEKETKALEEEKGLVSSMIDKIIGILGSSLKKTISKYLEEVKGIVYALSGMPSTPWHITVGNPLRPIFCSGDMYTTDVTLTLGQVLAFNDLPSSIVVSFTLQNARPWGMDEILAKFNTGHLRTVNVVADSATINPLESMGDNKYAYANGTAGTSGTSGTSANNVSNLSTNASPNSGSPSNTQIAVTETGASGTAGTAGTAGTVGQNAAPEKTTKENETQVIVNTNPNSKDPVVEGEKALATKTQTQNTSNTSTGNKSSAESKLGYTYEIASQGPRKWVIVKDKAGVVILETQKASSSSYTDEQLIKEAKQAVNDEFIVIDESTEVPTTAAEENTDSYGTTV
jgi:hypothetical protein